MGRTILVLITLPACGFWLYFCVLGVTWFTNGLLDFNSRYFPLGLLSWIGLVTLLVGLFSIFRYPKITKIEASIICVGITNMVSAIYIGPIGSFIGVGNSPFSLAAAIVLILVGVHLVLNSLNKSVKQTV